MSRPWLLAKYTRLQTVTLEVPADHVMDCFRSERDIVLSSPKELLQQLRIDDEATRYILGHTADDWAYTEVVDCGLTQIVSAELRQRQM